MLNMSWSNTFPSVASPRTLENGSSSLSHRTGAGGGRSPVNGARKMTSMMALRWSSPLGRKRYTMRL